MTEETTEDRIDKAFPHVARARKRVQAGERTPPHHHYVGGSHDLPHIVAVRGDDVIPGALYKGTCSRSSIECFIGLDAGIIVPCPACAPEDA